MADEEDAFFLCLQLCNDLVEGFFAVAVEVGIGFVEDNHGRVFVQRAGKTDTLALTAGEGAPADTDLGVVAIGHVLDHFMHAGELGGLDDLFRRRILAEAGNVFRDRTGEQLNRLRQVAEMLAEFVGIPVLQVGAVQADGAGRGGQTPTRARTKLDLPAPLGPTMASASPGLTSKLTPWISGALPPGATTATCSTVRLLFGVGSFSR